MTRAGWSGLAVLVALAAAGAGRATGQTVRAGPVVLDLSGRAQFQLSTSSVTEDDVGPGAAPPAVSFETRRVQFGTAFAMDDWLTGLVVADFGGATASLTDGYIDAAVLDVLGIRMGQFKKPFGLFDLTGNTKTLTIERGVRIPGITAAVGVPSDPYVLLAGAGYSGRQIGVMASGGVGAIGYAAGVFNGEGINTREARGSKAYAARATYSLGGPGAGSAGPLILGAAVSVQPTGVFDGGDEVHAMAFALDAELGAFRGDGLHVMAELAYGDDPLLFAADPPTMLGAHVAAGWFRARKGRIEGLEPVFRLSWADPDTNTANDSGLLVTPGFNVYFSGQNRLMVNADAYVPAADGLDTEYGLTTRFQVYF